jgi:ubiquinone/menaquinone biosynthesis C-methylase UbiE
VAIYSKHVVDVMMAMKDRDEKIFKWVARNKARPKRQKDRLSRLKNRPSDAVSKRFSRQRIAFSLSSFPWHSYNLASITMTKSRSITVVLLLWVHSVEAFVPNVHNTRAVVRTRQYDASTTSSSLDDPSVEQRRTTQKKALLELLGRSSSNNGQVDPVLADPETKEPIRFSTSSGVVLGSNNKNRVKYTMTPTSTSNTNGRRYTGSSDTYLNLLEPVKDNQEQSSGLEQAIRPLSVLIPPPLRSALAASGFADGYIPMRDLFTSPAVSFAYERGWRQGFAQAGFPGPDAEYEMAREYFAPAVVAKNASTTASSGSTVVDMSCATGLFTRRFAKSEEYDRVLGCDYSESMLTEARRRIQADPALQNLKRTKLDLVRLDVGKIPMQNNTVDALHAGAAMHCWPDLDSAAKEIYRVLKPGGRYFATTFLSSYFLNLQAAEAAGPNSPEPQAFQYFQSTDQLRSIMVSGGFETDKVQIEVLGNACVVIRCEK